MGKLTNAQRASLSIMLDETGGVAGSEWYFPHAVGGKVRTRTLNRRGLIEPNRNEGAGLLWRITNAGRTALEAPDATR